MLALKLALVGAIVLIASLTAKRFGHGVAGTLSGMPMIAGPIMGFVLWQSPIEHAREIALATLVAFPAMVTHMVVFARACRRMGWAGALVAANLVFLAVGAVLHAAALPPWAVCVLAAAAPFAGMRAMPPHRINRAALHIPRVELLLRVLAAVALAAAIMLGAAVFPVAVSGLLLALPITGNVLPCFTLPRDGADATIELLRGFVQGLFGFVGFFVTLYASLSVLGAAPAYGLSWLVALVLAQIGYMLHTEAAPASAT